MKFFACFVLIMSLVNFGYTQEFVVKSVCIIPTDASAPNDDVIDRFKSTVEDVRHFYKKEMERHGYGSKTFRLETDRNGEVVVNIIKGRYTKADYRGETTTRPKKEVPDGSNVYAVLIAGTDGIGVASIELDGQKCGGCSGIAYVAEKDYEFFTVAHELGHAFGLWHNLKGQENGENFLMWTGKHLEKYEARWLDKSPYFNQGFTADNPPKSTRVHDIKEVKMDGEDYVLLKIDIQGNNELYQAQTFRNSDHIIVAWDQLQGRRDTAEFMIRKTDLFRDNKVFIHFMDSRGNQALHSNPITIPLQIENVESVSAKGNITYLTLTSNHRNAIVPQNSSAEWAGWIGLLWEKTPGGNIPSKPQHYVNIATDILDKWDYWFYSHAPSRIVYELGSRNYMKFEAYFYMPNPCNDRATVELICNADGAEIYNSGILRGNQSRNIRISFNIPEDTETFTINVTNGGDRDTCDHFILANAYLVYETSILVGNRTDVNGDGMVNIVDLVLIAARYGETITGNPFPNPDVNGDGVVDIDDIILITNQLPVNRAPTLQGAYLPALLTTDLDNVYAILPYAVVKKGVSVLNQLFATVIPVATCLLPNYPNPFNPETWIPYQLSKPAEVTLTIYAVNGMLVRTLRLGHQSIGIYQDRKRAAYWDGKNETGEFVASGVYFYTLTAGDFTATRKMLIRK